MRRFLSLPILLCLSVGLGACGNAPSEDPLEALERELAEDRGDPAVASALADPIMTDTMLATRANANAVRPATGPYAAPIPVSDIAARGSTADLIAREKLDAAPAAQGDNCPECAAARNALTLASLAEPMVGRCAAALGYSNGWVTQLPATLPVLPNARVMEAAGTATDGCDVRVVRFWGDLPPDKTIDWYFTRTKASGFTFDRRADEIGERIAGRHPDGSRYTLFVDPRDRGGSDLVLVTSVSQR